MLTIWKNILFLYRMLSAVTHTNFMVNHEKGAFLHFFGIFSSYGLKWYTTRRCCLINTDRQQKIGLHSKLRDLSCFKNEPILLTRIVTHQREGPPIFMDKKCDRCKRICGPSVDIRLV